MPELNKSVSSKSEIYTRINNEVMEAFNTGDTEVLGRYIATNCVDHSMPPGAPNGLAGIKTFMKMWKDAFPDGRWTVEDTMVEGDRLSCRSTFTGTQKGALMGIPATNKKVNVEVTDWIRFEGDKCVEHWGNIDMATIQQQLGLAPSIGVNHTQTIQRLYGCFQRGDVASIVAQCAENVDWRNDEVASRECPWNGNFSGRKRLPDFFKAVAESLEFSLFEPRTFIEQGNNLCVQLRIESKVRKTGKTMKNDSVHLWTFDAKGLVTRYRHFNDTAAELNAYRP